ncbi:uncharacterized protein [Littorina saxatilis]|uniref:uncharacterized protein n=1 Tax=Littorina saxatilis TaxID=31220 RepID=UPI0038B64AB0
MTGEAKHQAEDRTDPSTCQQSGLSDAEDSGTLQQASMSKKEGWLHGAFWSMGRVKSSGTLQQASMSKKEGWLHGAFWSMGRVKQHWHIERYCVLDGQSKLVIYEDDTKTKVNAVCPLQQALDVTATEPSSYVFEIRMAGDVPPLVLASRDKADMLDWIYTLIDDIMFINGPAQHDNCPSQGMTGGAKHQAEDRTDPSTCQQSGLSDAEGPGTLQLASTITTAVLLYYIFLSCRALEHCS